MRLKTRVMKRKIIWRFDDLCFDKNSEYYISSSKVKQILDILYRNNQKANFALIITKHCFSKEAKNFITLLKKQGHEILAHGEPHCNWQNLTKKEIKEAAINMRKNLNLLGIKTNVFVFPGLKANPFAYKWLKLYGFDMIIKGDRLKKLSRIIDWFYSKIYCVKFIYQNKSTNDENWNLKPMKEFYDLLESNNNIIHVMDHLWLYKNKPLEEFENFIKITTKSINYITIKQYENNKKRIK